MKKYWGIFRNSFASILEYRSNLIGIVILQLMGAGVFVVLWQAAFKTNASIGGYNLSQLALYYLLVPFVGTLTQVRLSDWAGFEIKNGVLLNSLIKPFNIWLGYFMKTLSEKVNQLMILFPFYLMLSIILFYVFGGLAITLNGVILSFLIALCAFLMGFLFDLNICWLAFWMSDVWCFQHIKSIIFGILGGVSFPFEFLPQNLQGLFNFLPFKFMFYTPLGYLLGKRGLEQLPNDLLQIFLWALFFFALSFILWKRGLKAYEAFGN